MRAHHRRLVVGAAASALAACSTGALTAPALPARLIVHALTPATVRSLVVEVSGPGIDPAVVVNIPVGADSVARDTLAVPAGSGRRIVITAVDTGGVPTHRGDTTVALIPGENPPLAISMRPLTASLGITVTFGDLIAEQAPIHVGQTARSAIAVAPSEKRNRR